MTKMQKHVFATYLTLRYGIALITFAFPIVVWGAGKIDGVSLLGSLSAYYWASGKYGDVFAARTWFVGGLFAIGAFMYLYKGFTQKENVALNVAAVLAIGVALFPTARISVPDENWLTLHGACAVGVFACLAYVVWTRARDTLDQLPPEEEKKYRRRYNRIGVAMLVVPAIAYVLNVTLGRTPGTNSYVFFAESAGVWVFAWYWWTKSTELGKSEATKKALGGGAAGIQ